MADDDFSFDREDLPPSDNDAAPGGEVSETSAEGVKVLLDWFKQDMEDKLVAQREHIDELYRRIRDPEDEPEATSSCGGTPVKTLGTLNEGDETADTDSYDFSEGGTVKVWLVTDVVYNDAGDQILYQMKRAITLPACAVTAETRSTVDAPEDCTTPDGGSP